MPRLFHPWSRETIKAQIGCFSSFREPVFVVKSKTEAETADCSEFALHQGASRSAVVIDAPSLQQRVNPDR
jgi:hypothetical protein